MRRFGSLLSVVGIASALLLVGVPAAQAVEPPPPPVVPVESLPSTYTKSAFTGAGLADDQVKFAAWVLQQAKARQAGTAMGTTVANAVPITQAGALKGAAAGSVLTGAFMGGWMITDGTLALYAKSTGTNPLQGTCGWGDFGVSAVQVLYPFSSPNCTVPITTPNADVVPGSSVTYGGSTISYNGPGYAGSGAFCYTQTVPANVAGGVYAAFRNTSGVWSAVGAYVGDAYAGFCANSGRFRYQSMLFEGSQNSVGFVATTGGVTTVVAQMTTAPANPGRIPRCDLTWPDGSTTTRTGASFTQTGGVPLSSFNTLCNEGFVSKPGHGPGLLPSEIKIGSTREDTGAYTEIQKAPVPDFSPTEEKGLTPGTAGGLVLQKVVGTVTSSCMNWDADCANWWTATSSGTQPTTGDTTYRCTYNGEAVGLAECGVYRNTFDTRTSSPTITDPQTGTAAPWVAGAPNAGNSLNPGTGPGTSPGDQCMASWPAAPDPLSWVFWPVRCALVWAFVPRPAVVDAVGTNISSSFGATTAGTFIAGVGALGAVFANGPTGCGGLPFQMTLPGGIEINEPLFAACDEPMAGVAATVKNVLAMTIVVSGVLAVLRYVAGVFGYVGLGGHNDDGNGKVRFK